MFFSFKPNSCGYEVLIIECSNRYTSFLMVQKTFIFSLLMFYFMVFYLSSTMKILQTKKIEICRDSRGWSIEPVSGEEIKSQNITNLHIVSLKPGALRGNHYHLHMTEHMFVIGGKCKVTVEDSKRHQREEVIIENSVETLLIFPPLITHAVENIGSEMSYLFCYSRIDEDSRKSGTVTNKIVQDEIS